MKSNINIKNAICILMIITGLSFGLVAYAQGFGSWNLWKIISGAVQPVNPSHTICSSGDRCDMYAGMLDATVLTVGLISEGPLNIATTSEQIDLHFQYDTDTGINWEDDNELGFYTNNTEQVTIDQYGDLRTLNSIHMGDTGMAGTTGGAIFFADTSDEALGSDFSGIYRREGVGTVISSGPNRTLVLKDSGNVGIGTSTPDSLLTVDGTFAVGTDGVEFIVDADGNATTTGSFYVGSDRLVVMEGGNVGIGTANPAYLLDVDGNMRVGIAGKANTFFVKTISGNVGIGTADPQATLDIRGDVFTDRWYEADSNTFLGMGVAGGGGVDDEYLTCIGSEACYSVSGGYASVMIGYRAGYLSDDQQNNIFIGNEAGYNSTGGSYNTFIGHVAGRGTTDGDHNLCIGEGACWKNTTGDYNMFLGTQAGYYNTSATSTVAIGYQAGRGSSTGQINNQNNVLIGYRSGHVLTTGDNNTLLGYQTGDTLTIGDNNIIIGYDQDATSTQSNFLNIGGVIYGDLSSGNVGISTSTPSALLDIGKTAGSHTDLFIISSSTAGDLLKIDRNGNFAQFKADPYLNSDTNIFLGVGAGIDGGLSHSTGDEGYSNVAIGNSALKSITSGYSNIGIGTEALYSVAAGYGNISMGYRANYAVTTGDYNLALGHAAMRFNVDGNSNVAIGNFALYSHTGGDANMAIGAESQKENTTGVRNVGIGIFSLHYNEVGADNVIIGTEAGKGASGKSLWNNVIIGKQSGYVLESSNNILIGYRAGDLLTTGGNNILIGHNIDAQSSTTDGQLSIGNLIFGTGIDGTGTTTSSGNVGIGTTTPNQQLVITKSLELPVTTASDLGVIYKAGNRFIHDYYDTSTSGGNLFIGENAGNFTLAAVVFDKPIKNLGIGNNALQNLTVAYNSVAIGYDALLNLTSGEENTAIGVRAMEETTTGKYNVALGTGALSNNIIGDGNLVMGYDGMGRNTEGSDNVAIGYLALRYNLTGDNNIAIGERSGSNEVGVSNSDNIFIGSWAGRRLEEDADGNILIGYQAGDNMTTGAENIIIGYDIDAPSATEDNQLNIGDAIFGDLSSGNIGIGTSTPQNKLAVDGAITSGTMDMTTANDGAGIDVSGVNYIFVDTTGNVTINDFINGVKGQTLYIVIIDKSGNLTFDDSSGNNQQLFMHTEADLTIITELGGATFVCDGSDWWDVSHAKHVP